MLLWLFLFNMYMGNMKSILSGIQSSGHLQLGNYLGAITRWVGLQEEYDCYYFIADLHAITVPQDPVKLQESIFEVLALYIASGIDPKKSCIFAQSHVPAHAELGWLFNCVTPMGWLSRMTQFKDKAGKQQDQASLGLFAYPALMAADILLYQPDFVPVGADQKQHLELTRDIAGAINRKFGKELLKLPEPLITGPATRIMSLRDGTKKMAKSDPSDNSRINLLDTEDLIIQKIKKAKTDAIEEIYFDSENRPEVSNLLNIFSALSNKPVDKIAQEYKNSGFAKFKSDLADIVAAKISPISTEAKLMLEDKAYLLGILKQGSEKAAAKAEKVLKPIKKEFGFITF